MKLAVHVPGCARQVDGGIAITSRVGPLVEGLAELSRETVILAYDPPPVPSLEDRTDYVVSVERSPVRLLSLGPRGTWRTYFERRRRVRNVVGQARHDWDLIFLPLVNRRVGLVARASLGARWVFHIGGHSPSVVKQSTEPGIRRARALALAWAAELTYIRLGRRGVFLANAETLLDRYRRWIPDADLVRTSVRRDRFQRVVEDRLTTTAPNVALYGRLAEAKGVHDAVEAFSLFHSELPDSRLHVIGTGPSEEALRSQAAQLGLEGAVTWHGWIPPGEKLFELLGRMDVLVTLSRAEALPNAVPEAMAHSVLVISTAVGALPRAFESEVHLLFVPEGDPAAAADALRRLRRDGALRRRLLKNGFEAAAPLSVEQVARRIVELAGQRWPELTRVDDATG